jgi:Na+-driven multidrug efflux pump
VLAIGTTYLPIVGPTYVFLGFGLALYFASQGAGQLLWPLLGSVIRLAAAVGGGRIMIRLFGSGVLGPFAASAAATVLYGVFVVLTVYLSNWSPVSRPVRGETRKLKLKFA